MRYLLDTNVCVDYLTGRYPGVAERLRTVHPADVAIRTAAERCGVLQFVIRHVDFRNEKVRISGNPLSRRGSAGKLELTHNREPHGSS